MNKLASSVIFILCSFSSIAQQDAEKFHNQISSQFDKISIAINKFNESIIIYDGDSILNSYKNLLQVTESAVRDFESIVVPVDGKEYYKAAFDLLQFYLTTYENDYFDAVAILFRLPLNDNDIAEVERIFDRVELKETILLKTYNKMQILYCNENKIDIDGE